MSERSAVAVARLELQIPRHQTYLWRGIRECMEESWRDGAASAIREFNDAMAEFTEGMKVDAPTARAQMKLRLMTYMESVGPAVATPSSHKDGARPQRTGAPARPGADGSSPE